MHHTYDPNGGVLMRGDGTQRDVKVLGNLIELVPGTQGRIIGGGSTTFDRANPGHLAVGPDGSVYVAYPDEGVVRRLRPDGSFVVHATFQAWGMALGPDGSVYGSDRNGNRVRRVAPDGSISVVAGTGVGSSTGDGGPAVSATINGPGALAVGPDGSLYIAEENGHRVRRVGPDGIIRPFAGSGSTGFSGDGGPATAATLYSPVGLAVGKDGSVFIGAGTNNQFFDVVRRVGPDGKISTVAGQAFFQPGSTPATQRILSDIKQVAVSPDDALIIATRSQLFRVDRDGSIAVVSGQPSSTCSSTPSTGSCQPSNGNGGLATQAYFFQAWGVALASNGVIYVSDRPEHQVRVIRPALPAVSVNDMLVASEDGAEVYLFDQVGRHRVTLHGLTGDTLLAFGYDVAGRLASVKDAAGDLTVIERDGTGRPTAIVAPDGHRTALAVDGTGFLTSATNPNGEIVRLFHSDNGLLDSLADPRGKVHRFQYDSRGRLIRDEHPAGGFKALARTQTDTSYTVSLTSSAQAARRYTVHADPGDQTRVVMTGSDGLLTTTTRAPSGTTTTVTPDGATVTQFLGGDPRFGMQAPVLRSLIVRQPSGLIGVMNEVRRAVRTDTLNPFSVVTLLDSVKLNGLATVTTYQTADRRATTVTPAGRQMWTRIDSVGRLVAERLAGLDSVTYQYDAQGRPSEMRTGGRVWTYSYDPKGRLLSTLDPLGRRDSLFYDDADRLTRRVLPGGREVRFAYDSSGNLTSLTPPGRTAHTFASTAVDLDSLYTPTESGCRHLGHRVPLQPGPAAHRDPPAGRGHRGLRVRRHDWAAHHSEFRPGHAGAELQPHDGATHLAHRPGWDQPGVHL